MQDANTRFSNAQAITASAASTNTIDLGVGYNLGVGGELYIEVVVTTAFTDASSNSTITVTLETDDNTSFSSATTLQTIGTFAALSAIGTRLTANVPYSPTLYERYIRLYYTAANGDLTTGAVTAYAHASPVDNVANASGYTVTNT